MCTNMTLKAADGSVIVARSMENAAPMDSEVFFRARETVYHQDIDQIDTWLKMLNHLAHANPDSEPTVALRDRRLLSWQGQYAFVGITVLESGVASHGMNEKGLVTGTMTLTVSEYHAYEEINNNLVYLYLTNFLLSNCATCQDVIDGFEQGFQIRIPGEEGTQETRISVINPFENLDSGFYCHFPVNDAKGNALVIEYIDGQLQIHDNTGIGVLTNAPDFQWQVTNLSNYTHVQPVNIQGIDSLINTPQSHRYAPSSGGVRPDHALKYRGIVRNPLAHMKGDLNVQGTGFVGMPGSSTPADRFVRAHKMATYAYQPETAEQAVVTASHLLNTVDIPLGTSREWIQSDESNNSSDYTQWVTISDTAGLKYYIRGYDSPLMYSIDLNDFKDDSPNTLNQYQLSIPGFNVSPETIAIPLRKGA